MFTNFWRDELPCQDAEEQTDGKISFSYPTDPKSQPEKQKKIKFKIQQYLYT